MAIHIYRNLLKPLMLQSCRFEPTCSHFAEDAILRYGLFSGSWKAICRLSQCQPWGRRGWDPVR